MGGFLIGLGVFSLALFVISDSVQQPEFGLLAGGFGLLVVGIFLVVTHPLPAPPPSPRFRVLRRSKGEPTPKREQPKSAPPAKPAGPPGGGGGGKPPAKPAAPPAGGKPAAGGKPGAGPPAGKK
jgi:hypothetical protein